MSALARLEEILISRIGAEHVANLHNVLAQDWGPEVESLSDEELRGTQ